MDEFARHLEAIEPGAWIFGVSGGSDSVALLRLITQHRRDITPIVAHVDHQLRGAESDADAEFVRSLAGQLKLHFEIGKRRELDPTFDQSKANRAARLRLIRQRFFIDLVKRFGARGVLLAHQADDQAETVLLRLLRGGELSALAGIRRQTTIRSTTFCRPLLSVRRAKLEAFLGSIRQPWQIDSSNLSPGSPRARVRQLLSKNPSWTDALLTIARAGMMLDRSVEGAKILEASFEAKALGELPDIIARRIARRWLMNHGSPADALTSKVVSQLIEMSRDRAAPSRQSFPGGLLVERASGWIRCQRQS
ncbi:MAG TPA: tRNA lysidine(34) synthetase TilS [Tepidisphaeraceae bacterium]|nr:tRNA lysidine(34) synthetase TilS [Tepidisphaeraceae bacterium]